MAVGPVLCRVLRNSSAGTKAVSLRYDFLSANTTIGQYYNTFIQITTVNQRKWAGSGEIPTKTIPSRTSTRGSASTSSTKLPPNTSRQHKPPLQTPPKPSNHHSPLNNLNHNLQTSPRTVFLLPLSSPTAGMRTYGRRTSLRSRRARNSKAQSG